MERGKELRKIPRSSRRVPYRVKYQLDIVRFNLAGLAQNSYTAGIKIIA
jgi:hypothetical protein